MRTQFKRSLRLSLWIGGISVCLLTGASMFVMVGSIPASHASIPNDDRSSNYAAAQDESRDLVATNRQMNAAIPQVPTNHRNWAWCPTCGVVESMRQIEHSGKTSRQELTIRLRDGGTLVLDEATRRSWQPGNRVIVIGGLNAAASSR